MLTGQAAYGDWRSNRPGLWRGITPADMPAPYATESAGNPPRVIPRPSGASLHAPPGFTVEPFATGLNRPRMVRVAPDGEIFVAETDAGRVRLMRAPDGAARPSENVVFADGLRDPFGIAFWPPGPAPRFVYVAERNRVVRFPWHEGAPRPDGPAQVVVPEIAPSTGGHWTRDVAFSPDGQRMYLAVGSATNDAEGGHPEQWRAQVIAFDPEGKGREAFATGLRNCVSLAIAPGSGTPWCAVNERDGLGNNLPPDYVTHLEPGGFYGWPWFYIGDHPDPTHHGAHPELAARVLVPDVLIQPHSAPLGMTFYEAHGPAAFGADYQGDIFVALHGSWNRSLRTGYKLVRIHPGKDAYEDFVTGFVAGDQSVWGRPVAVAVAHDGALLMSDDAGNAIWRVAPAAHP
ncbi:MAG TPA: PQQ-dependent sugar dehydrogenase [Acetobacteraceae bacterium]|nr:PQQ-dependent sugar dehydrogenase [Acetobacteraceae bacterium]